MTDRLLVPLLDAGAVPPVRRRAEAAGAAASKPADSTDELVLEATINGQADALVTYNVRHFAQAAARFGLRLARPAEVLEEIST